MRNQGMGGVRRIGTLELRTLIREEARRLREMPEGPVDVGTEFGLIVSQFIASHLDGAVSEIAEDFEANAPDDVPVPARPEDVEHFADQAAEVVMNDSNVRSSVANIIAHAMRAYGGLV